MANSSERDIFVYILGRKQTEILKNRADITAKLQELDVGEFPYVPRAEKDRAFGGNHFGKKHLEECGLAGARMSDDGDEFSRVNSQRNVGDGGRGAVKVYFCDFVVENHESACR